MAALVILSNSLDALNLDDLALGSILLLLNLLIIFMAGGCILLRYKRERTQQSWRKALTTKQLEIVANIMGSDGPNAADQDDAMKQRELEQYLVKEEEVFLEKRIGRGAFGEVFRGKAFGQEVAIKSMVEVGTSQIIPL